MRRTLSPPSAPPLPHLRSVAGTVTAVALALLAAASCGNGDEDDAPAAPRPPHVLLLVLDTTRADRCSVHGYARPTTPALERFAADAAVFDDALTPAPWTAPAHGSLFTGLRPEHHGLTSDGRMFLADRSVTLAEHLRAAGYVTAGFTTNPVVNPGFGLAQGFDRFDELAKEPQLPYPHAPLVHDRVLDVLEEARTADRRAFVFVNHMEPHLPYTPPEEIADGFVRGAPSAESRRWARALKFPEFLGHNVGSTRFPPADVALLSDLYDAEIATLDRELGTLFDALASRGLLDETLVIVTSDHGENLDEHGLLDHMFDVHRTLLHVPLVVRLPGVFDGGRRESAQVRLEDVLPTVLQVCGLPVPEGLDGTSLVPRDGAPLAARPSIAHFGEPATLLATIRAAHPDADLTALEGGLWSVHHDGLHLIRRGDGRTWLYDVRTDPLEQTDLAAQRPDDVHRLEALLPGN